MKRAQPVRRLAIAVALAAGLAAFVAQAQTDGAALPSIRLSAGIHVITAEVAADDLSRTTGLMRRRELAPNHGMLFIFSQPETPCMWMRNTLVALSVAFINADGSVVNIEDMEPNTDQIHCARRSVPYALEMERGWFADRGLAAGRTTIAGLPSPARAGAR